MTVAPRITLLMEDVNGNQTAIELPGPGDPIRVAVGEPGRRSGIWRIWASKNKSDVYIAIRSIAGYQKWSLHETGDWRFQWVTEGRAREFTQKSDRRIHSWPQPPELEGTGWTKGFSILFRHQDVVPVPDDDESSSTDVAWVPPPDEGFARGIHVVIARPDGPLMELRGLLPFDGFALADGRAVLLVTSVSPVTDDLNQMLDRAVAKVLERAPTDIDLRTARGLRMAVLGELDGDKRVWDIAWQPSP